MIERETRFNGHTPSRQTQPFRVAVIHMEHWGGAGNSLWAWRIARALRHAGRFEVEIAAADTQGTFLHEQALLIATIKAQPLPPAAIRRHYNNWAAELRRKLESLWDVESGLSPSAERIISELPYAKEIEQFDFVICTKGLLTQLASRSARRDITQEGAARVVNFVTNPGLLDLSIHRPSECALHVISDPSWMSALTRQGYSPESIRCCALLENTAAEGSSSGHIPTLLSGFDLARPIVVFIANQEGGRWLTLVRHVLERLEQAQLIFICIRDEELLRDATILLEQYPTRTARVTSLLRAPDRDALLAVLAECDAPVVITKPGPSTVATIGSFGIPMVMWDAGLPMEDWVLRSASTSGTHCFGASVEEVFRCVETMARKRNPRKPWRPMFEADVRTVTQMGIDEILLQTLERGL